MALEDHLPDEIRYDDLMSAFATLLPNTDPTRVSYIRITNSGVEVEWWAGSGTARTTIPVRHQQGSATEGGNTT